MEQIPPKLQNQIMQFQQVQQQAQAISTQRMQLDLHLKEVERSLAEVEKLDDNAEIYKNVGAILMRSRTPSIKGELQENKETMELRIKTLQRQEKKIQQRLKEMQGKIQEELKAGKTNIGSAG
ncbi:MAG: prefoldin subunit beta [Candidatus Hydrothermarchaeota archaeon]|nr:prefoldin subunit beta [Candidatus Hydrothermarchaeota archaeon]